MQERREMCIRDSYDALKSVNNLVKDARKVSEIILMVGDVSEIYVTNFQKMLGLSLIHI